MFDEDTWWFSTPPPKPKSFKEELEELRIAWNKPHQLFYPEQHLFSREFWNELVEFDKES